MVQRMWNCTSILPSWHLHLHLRIGHGHILTFRLRQASQENALFRLMLEELFSLNLGSGLAIELRDFAIGRG